MRKSRRKNAVCPHVKCAELFELCIVRCTREMCASARVQVGVVLQGSAFVGWQNVHQCSKVDFLFPCCQNHVFLALHMFCPTLFASGHLQEHRKHFFEFFVIHRIQSSFRVVIFMISRMSGFQTLSRGFMRCRDTCILSLPIGFCDPSCLSFLRLPFVAFLFPSDKA